MRARATRPPAAMVDFQRWFSRAAARPLLPGNLTRPQGVDGPSLRHEADARLNSVNGLSGLERLEVYNRQYWFRLITIMQEEFPCCLHVIGLDAFNGWVIRYLDAMPPTSPYLALMDSDFPAFLGRRFRGNDREKVLEATAYDKAFSRAFDGRKGSLPLQPSDGTKWVLAGHVTPLWLQWDFAAYRALCRADEALTGRFPLRRAGKNGRVGQGVCLHRHDDTVYEKPITRAEFLLLRALEKPRTLDQVLRAAQRETTAREQAAMERNVGAWFKDWTELGWIGEDYGDDAS